MCRHTKGGTKDPGFLIACIANARHASAALLMLRIVHVLAWFSAAVAVWIASLRSGLPASQHLAVLCVRPTACSARPRCR